MQLRRLNRSGVWTGRRNNGTTRDSLSSLPLLARCGQYIFKLVSNGLNRTYLLSAKKIKVFLMNGADILQTLVSKRPAWRQNLASNRKGLTYSY